MTLQLPTGDTRTLLPLQSAVEATQTSSTSAFYRWATRYRVKPFRHGLYLRSELAAAMDREEAARKRRARK